jgi:hypothetical protein
MQGQFLVEKLQPNFSILIVVSTVFVCPKFKGKETNQTILIRKIIAQQIIRKRGIFKKYLIYKNIYIY